MSTLITVIIIALVLLILLSLIGKDSKYSHLGINLKRVYCPKCNLKQPIIRKPKNDRQAQYGGYTCENCKTEMDKYGDEIEQIN